MLYMSMPESLLRRYPQMEKNLLANQQRLVTPYDLFATFKYVIVLSLSLSLSLSLVN